MNYQSDVHVCHFSYMIRIIDALLTLLLQVDF